MIKDKRMTNEEALWFGVYSFLIFLIIMATLFMIINYQNASQTMDYIVAVGTVALAIIAMRTINESKKSSEDYTKKIDRLVSEMGRSRAIQYTLLQIDELYMPIISHGNSYNLGIETDEKLYGLIKQKKYLGEPNFIKLLDEYIWAKDACDFDEKSKEKMILCELDIKTQAELDLRILQQRMASMLMDNRDAQ